MKKSLIILLLSCLQFFASFGQITPTTVSGGVVTLSGKGKIGGTKDGAQWRRYKFARSGNFFLSAYIRSVTNSANSFTGIAFRNETTGLKSDGGLPAVALFFENDTLKAKTKLTQDSKFVDVAILPNVKVPGWLKIEKNNNTVKFYYSTSAENATSPSYTQMTAVANVFAGWNTITQNFATGNRLGTNSTSVISNIQFGGVTGDGSVPCTNGGTFDVLSVTQNNGNIYDVNFNAANLNSVNVDIKNASNVSVRNFTTAVVSKPLTIDIGTQTAGNYTLTLTGQSCSGVASKNFEIIGLITTGGGGGTGGTGGSSELTAFVNPIKNVPVVTANGIYNPDAFPTITTATENDPVIGKLFPKWSISWKVEGTNFSNALRNKRTPSLGIPFMFDMGPVPYGGYGVRCVDYVYVQNPNTGQVWQADEACTGSQYNQYFNNLPHTIANFSSALPFHERAGDGGGAGLEKIAQWDAISDLSYFYDHGHIGGEKFGFRDWINGKANVGLSDYDNEATFQSDKSLAILLGLASKSQGYVFDQYANILGGVIIDPSQYPNDFNNPNSTYPQYTQLMDGTNGAPNSGVPELITNNVPTREFWNPAYKISIPSKFNGTKGVIDEPTILPSTEISCLSSATFRQGESYVFNTTGSTRVVNKFGLNANTQHMIARTIFSGETSKWYCVNRLNNRKMILQAKILCDQQQNGILLDENYANTYITNRALANKHFDREFSFDIGAFVAFTGCEWNIWDRNNADVNLDGYHGVFGIINLLNQRKTFGTESKSFVDLKSSAKFLLWESEISYDGGTTYVKDKANHYVMNSTKIPQRQFITPSGYWGGFLARPENTEALSCKLRVSYGGQYYYYTITPEMWETTDYNSRSIPLAGLSNDKKDYHYFLIKLSLGNTTEGTSIIPPSIIKNIASPTAGQSVIFTSSGCQSGYTNKWYDSAEGNLLASGNTFTVNASNGDGFFAKCVGTSGSSSPSNIITFSITPPVSGSVTITEPNKPAYHFSNGQAPSHYDNTNNLPAIFTGTNGYDATNEFVWLTNDKIKIALNLKRGGQLAWASLINDNTNLVYNGYDGGFQVQLDAYQRKDGYVQNGKYSRAQFSAEYQYNNNTTAPAANNLTSYNVTQGGDFNNHCQTLVDYHRVGNNGYYIKLRPIFYTIDSEFSQTYIEVTYTLDGYALKCDYRYTTYRTDGQYDGSGFDGGHAPVCFLVNNLTRYKSYVGNQPWTRTNRYSDIDDGALPNETAGQSTSGTPLTKNSRENWAMVYNPDNQKTIGVYANDNDYEGSFSLKQKDIYDLNGGRVGGEFNGGYTILGRNYDLGSSFNRSSFSKNISSYLIVTPNPNTFIDTVYQISGH